MGNISVRLPEEIEAILEHEAQMSHQSRSELVREAITEYVARRERQRFQEQMASAARALAADENSRREALDIAEGALDDGLDRDAEGHGSNPVAPGERW